MPGILSVTVTELVYCRASFPLESSRKILVKLELGLNEGEFVADERVKEKVPVLVVTVVRVAVRAWPTTAQATAVTWDPTAQEV